MDFLRFKPSVARVDRVKLNLVWDHWGLRVWKRLHWSKAGPSKPTKLNCVLLLLGDRFSNIDIVIYFIHYLSILSFKRNLFPSYLTLVDSNSGKALIFSLCTRWLNKLYTTLNSEKKGKNSFQTFLDFLVWVVPASASYISCSVIQISLS